MIEVLDLESRRIEVSMECIYCAADLCLWFCVNFVKTRISQYLHDESDL